MKRQLRNILIVCLVAVCVGGEILDILGFNMHFVHEIGTAMAGIVFAAISKEMWKKRFNQYWTAKGHPEKAINSDGMLHSDWKTDDEELNDRYRSSNYFVITIAVCAGFIMIKDAVIYGFALK